MYSKIRQDFNTSITARTLKKRLNEGGLFGRVAVKKRLVSEMNQKAGLRFAHNHLN